MDEQQSRLSLDRQLCFALHSASRAFTNLYRPVLEEFGLTYPQYLVMLVLWEHDELAVKDLGAALRLDSGTLSPLLKRLEARGLLVRWRSAGDERSLVVAPTESGWHLRERARCVPDRMVEATGMDLDDVAELRSTLERLTASVDAAAEAARTERRNEDAS